MIPNSHEKGSLIHLEALRNSSIEVATQFQSIIIIINWSILKFTPDKLPRKMT